MGNSYFLIFTQFDYAKKEIQIILIKKTLKKCIFITCVSMFFSHTIQVKSELKWVR